MNERTLSSQTVFDGRLLNVETLEVELAAGVCGRREVVRHPGATAILPELPDGRFGDSKSLAVWLPHSRLRGGARP